MGGSELEYVKQAFEANYIAPIGPQLAEFERRFSEVTGLPHCVAVSGGTAAIHLALRLSGVGPGDVVIASTLTFIGSVSSISFLGAEPVFVDCDRATWNMDPDLAERAIENARAQGKRVAAVLPTDLYGQCADYDRLREICDRYGIPLILDAAEALGAAYKDRHAGVGGRAAIYSFNGNKIITTSGGGMLASEDADFIAEARRLSQQARDEAPHYEHTTIGYNYRMSNVSAAIGIGQLEVLAERVKQKRQVFEWYREELAGMDGISFMPEADYGTSSCWLTVVQLDQKRFGASPETVRLALEAENIESRPVWKPMHMQPVYAGMACEGGDVARELFENGLCLPSGTALERGDVERIAGIVRGCMA